MRQWHRWLGISFAAFLLVIGATGVMIQMFTLTLPKGAPPAQANRTSPDMAAANGERHKHHDGASAPVAPVPDRAAARPRLTGARAWAHWVKDLHSGALFGPVGLVISMLSGLAMFFFAGSGVWMYAQMFARRRAAGRPSFFWTR